MKLIEMRCPNCDAPLSVNADRDEAFCRHCNTTFLIEDAPRVELPKQSDTDVDPENERPKPEEHPVESPVEFEAAKSELPGMDRFAGAIAVSTRAKADAHSAKQEAKSEVSRKTEVEEEAVVPIVSSESKTSKRPTAIAIAVVVVLLIVIVATMGTCSTHDSRSSSSKTGVGSSSAASSSAASPTEVSQASSGSMRACLVTTFLQNTRR